MIRYTAAMVHFATVREFRINSSAIFRRLKRGDKVVVTRNGKPIGILEGVADTDLEDFTLAHHPAYRKRHESARREHKKGKLRRLDEILDL